MSRRLAPSPPAPRGFTLLELLIALGIFSLVSVMAYSGLDAVLSAREQTRQQSERLAALERTVLLLGRDVVQAVDRPVRDALGDPLPAFTGGPEAPLELTRAGAAELAGVPRSALHRVAWTLDEGTLVRETWSVLDRAHASEPYSAPLLEGVEAVEVGFLTPGGEWTDRWPPSEEDAPALPQALSVALELEHWGTITRLWEIPGGRP